MTPLHHIGAWLREAFSAIPIEVARGLFVAMIIALAVWVIRLPPGRTKDGEGQPDLRPWAALALGIQVILYLVF